MGRSLKDMRKLAEQKRAAAESRRSQSGPGSYDPWAFEYCKDVPQLCDDILSLIDRVKIAEKRAKRTEASA